MAFGQVAEPIEQSEHGEDLPAVQQGSRVDGDEVAGSGEVAAGDVVPDCGVHVAVGAVPCGGGEMQIGEAAGDLASGFQSEQVAQQVVVAEGGAGVVETDDQLVRGGDALEPHAAVGRSGDGVDHGAGEAVEDRRLDQPPAVVGLDRRE